MTKIQLTIFLLVATFLGIQAQATYQGKILDAITQQPIEFVNIGIINNPIGTVSDESGKFSLKKVPNGASIQFSSIGYESTTILATALTTNPTVYLQPVAYQTEMVNLNAQAFGPEQKIGKEIKRKNTIWGLPFSHYLGSEIGTKIKINRETIIKSVHFGMHARSPDSILYRVNLYDFKDGKAGKNLITQNVYAYTHEIADYGKIDLSHLNIVVNDDVLLTLQIVKREAGFDEREYVMFRIRTWLYDNNIYYREASQTDFRKPRRGVVNDRIGFYLVGKQAGKTKKLNVVPEPIIDQQPTLSTWQDSLAYLFEKSDIPGLAVSVIKKDSLVFQQTYGQANVAESRPYTNQTTQPIASVSKTFIGLALMQLIKQGHFELETPINDVLPFDVVNPHHPEQQITIRQLATHTSGIYDTTAYYGHSYFIENGENANLPTVKAMQKEGLSFGKKMDLGKYLKSVLTPEGRLYDTSNFLEVGTDRVYAYSNIGASLAAYLVEVTTQKSYADYVREHIFQPLGMTHSSFDRYASTAKQRATLYASKTHPFPEYNNPSYPEGWVNTTNEDMAIYLVEMLKGFKEQGKLLSTKGYQTLFTRKSPLFINGKNGDIHAVFWDIAGPRIQHNGGDFGILSILSFNTTTDSGYFMMANINPDSVGKELQIDGSAIFNQLLAMLDLVTEYEERALIFDAEKR
ncbi:MAG: serine hydrolase [Bacteroidota bacterium]